MKNSRDAAGNLIITNVETFLAFMLVLCMMGTIAVWFTPVAARTAAGWSAIFALLSLAVGAAQERSHFMFDRTRGVLTWRKASPFSYRAGEITLQGITALSVERERGQGSRGFQRLVIHTLEGPLPVTTAYSGRGRSAEATAETIRAYLGELLPQRQLPLIKA